MVEKLAGIFSTKEMVKPELRRGEITGTKPAYKELMNIALPAILEMVSIAVISMADTAMVGKMVNESALAAVGLTGQPRMIFMSFFFAMNIAVTAIVSRRKGQGDQNEAKLCVRTAIILELGLILIMSVLQVVTADWLMRLAGAVEGETLKYAVDYHTVMGIGLLFPAMSTTICAAQRGVGNTRITMVVNITANLVNVLFNYLLIGGNFGFPRLEVQGAAIATVIGNGVGLVLAIRSITRKDCYLRVTLKDKWRLDKAMVKVLARLTGGGMIEQVAMRVGFFWFAAIIAGLGTDNFAAHQIAMQLMNLSFTFADGIAAATTSLVGQNMGKKRPDLSIMFGKIGQRVAMCIAVGLLIIAVIFRSFFAQIFANDPYIIGLAADVVIILALLLPIQTSQIVMGGSLRGAGDTRYVALTMLLTVTVIRPGLSTLFIHGFGWGLHGAWYAIFIDQIVRLVLLFTRFSRGKWISISV